MLFTGLPSEARYRRIGSRGAITVGTIVYAGGLFRLPHQERALQAVCGQQGVCHGEYPGSGKAWMKATCGAQADGSQTISA